MSCPVSQEEFEAACRAPLFEGQWNAWLMLRTTSDLPPKGRARQVRLEDELGMWFAGWAHHVRVKELAEIPPTPIDGRPTYQEEGVKVTRTAWCEFGMTLVGDGFVPIYVQFVPIASAPGSIEWPALEPRFGTGNKQMQGGCPIDAWWLLDRVLTPSEKDVPEPPSGILETLSQGTIDGRPAVPYAADVVKALVVAGVVYIVVQVLKTVREVSE